MRVQYWRLGGYEATADLNNEPVPGSALHTGTNPDTGERVCAYFDEALHRWQEIDPDLSAGDDPEGPAQP